MEKEKFGAIIGIVAILFVAVAIFGFSGTPAQAQDDGELKTYELSASASTVQGATCGAGGAACDGSCGGSCGGTCGAAKTGSCGCGAK